MSSNIFKEIIKQCSTKTMSTMEIQLILWKVANYLKEAHEIKQNENVHDFLNESLAEWKDHLNVEISRIQDVLMGKLSQIEIIKNKIGVIHDEMDKVSIKIQQQISGFVQIQKNYQYDSQINERIIENVGEHCLTKINALNTELQVFQKVFTDILVETKESVSRNLRSFQQTSLQNYQNERKSNLKSNIMQMFENQKWFHLFSFDGQILQKVNDNYSWHQFIFSSEVQVESLFVLKAKILQLGSKKLKMGISLYNMNLQPTHNALGALQDLRKKQLNFMQLIEANTGQIVEMIVDRQKSFIKWTINDKEVGSWETQGWNFCLETILPEVELFNVGDAIQISY